MFRPRRLVVLLFLACAAAAPLALRAGDDPEYGDWKTVSPAAGYEVQLPKNVRHTQSSSRSANINGQAASFRFYVAETTDDIGFCVADLEITDKLKKISNDDLFKGFQAGFAQGSGYRLTNGKKVKVDGKPGMEWTVRDGNGADGVVRMFRASPDRIILLCVAGKGIASSADVVASRFLKSYKENPNAKGPAGDHEDKLKEMRERRDAARGGAAGRTGSSKSASGAKLSAFKPEKIADPTKMEGLVSYWSFDDGEGETAKDQGPAKLDVTLEGKKWVEGVKGKAVKFNGQTGVGEIPKGKALHFKEDAGFTISGWFQIGADRESAGTLLSMRHENDGAAVVDLFVTRWTQLKVQVRCDGNEFRNPAEVTTRDKLTPDVWHHFAIRRSEEGTVALYLDAERVGSADGAAGAITTNLRGIGCERYWQSKGGAAIEPVHFKGLMDEVCVFSRALTAEEIANLAGRGGAGKDTAKDADKDKAKP